MAVSTSTYYDLTRIRESSPEAKDWSTVDLNWEIVSLLIKQLEGNPRTGAATLKYPGYNNVDPNTPTLPDLTASTTGGVLPPGATIGVRLAYTNAIGLETDASPETNLTLPAAAERPLTPTYVGRTVNATGLSGGVYIYVITKVKASGETLASDVLGVEVPYDNNYNVEIGFDPISGYTDGTTSLRIYRSAGLNSQFVLVATVTTGAQTTYVDDNTAPESTEMQPPSANTFDANRKVTIDWSGITHPGDATRLRVYVTQQANLWSTTHLVQEYDLTASPPTFYDYLGTESLLTGWPKNSSQIPNTGPKINLSTEATGAPTLTANMDFAGFQAKNMRLDNSSGAPASPTNGYIYYDTSTNNVRAYINGSWVDWGVAVATAYTHPAEETGGHIAANIRHHAGAATPTVKTFLDVMADSTTGVRKQVAKVQRNVGVTPDPTITAPGGSVASLIPEMNISGLLPDFDNQFIKLHFSGHFKGSAAGMNLSVALEWDGSTIEQTVRTHTVPFTNGNVSFDITYIAQMGTIGSPKQARVLWWIDTGVATAVTTRRVLTTEILF